MHPPAGRLGKLSLNKTSVAMAPVTRSQSSHHDEESSRLSSLAEQQQQLLHGVREEEADEEDADEDEDEDDQGPVRSPMTGLLYNVDGLDDETQELVRELFRRPAPEETPPMVVEWCGISNDPDVYAFQLREVVPRTIRIGSPTSRIPRPSCNCTGSAARPCRHLVWLMDQIARQTLHDHHADQPLVLDAHGFPPALAGHDAHRRIADFHIGVLASTLHCSAGPPVSGRPGAQRLREAREVLAGLAGVRDDVGVDAYAPDVFDVGHEQLRQLLWGGRTARQNVDDSEDSEDGGDTSDDSSSSRGSSSSIDRDSPQPSRSSSRRSFVERGDLQRTVLRLLVSNDEFFALFLKLLGPSDKARDPFRKIQQRVEQVLDTLSGAMPALASEEVSVAWAARHVENAVRQIRMLLPQQQQQQQQHREQQRHRQRHSRQRASACRALVWIFNALVFRHNRDVHAGPTQDDRNLYQRLVGNAGGTSDSSAAEPPSLFLLDELQMLCDQVQFRTQLERIRRRIQINGYRQPYMRRLEEIIIQMRAIRVEEETEDDSDDDGDEGDDDDDDDNDDNDNNDDGHNSSPLPSIQTLHRTVAGPSSSSAAGSKRHRSSGWPSSDRGPKRVREAG